LGDLLLLASRNGGSRRLAGEWGTPTGGQAIGQPTCSFGALRRGVTPLNKRAYNPDY
jgi:hypothetical protein